MKFACDMCKRVCNSCPTYVQGGRTYCHKCSDRLLIGWGDVIIGSMFAAIFYFSGGIKFIQAALGDGIFSMLVGYVMPAILMVTLVHAFRRALVIKMKR